MLFILPKLARPFVSVEALRAGGEALSGTESSTLLVVDGLVRRGLDVALFCRDGARIDGPTTQFETLDDATAWLGAGLAVLCTWQDDLVEQFSTRPPWVWTHLPLSRSHCARIESGAVERAIVVSDTVRLPFLHSCAAHRVARVYNPLSPNFSDPADAVDGMIRLPNAVFTGYVGESKGLHHVLRLWPFVRESVPGARLLVAGAPALYSASRIAGPMGFASSTFENTHIKPLIEKFGSLPAAGVHFLGLQSPQQLRRIYQQATIGLVNPNFDEFTETFCCAGVEMLACGLPVFGAAAGSLPETLGRSGAAILAPSPDYRHMASLISGLLSNPRRASRLGKLGQRFVHREYSLNKILDRWADLLPGERTPHAAGGEGWNGPIGPRYVAEQIASWTGLGSWYRCFLDRVSPRPGPTSVG